MLHAYLVTITMPDGSQGRHEGLYTDGCAAVIVALECFPGMRRVSARRIA